MKYKGETIFTNKKDIANATNKKISGHNDLNTEHTNIGHSSFLNNTVTSSFSFEPITLDKLDIIVSDINIKHSCGDDGISSYILSNLYPFIKQPLLGLIDLSIRQSIFPKS